MKTTSRIASATIAAAAILALAIPAFAGVGASVSVNVSTNANTGGGVAQAGASIRERLVGAATSSLRERIGAATSTKGGSDNRLGSVQDRGDRATQNRIDVLNALSTRVNNMKLLTANEKATLVAEINQTVSSMNTVQANLASATSSAAARAELQTVAPDYRVYMLVVPQVTLLSATERINSLIASLQTVQSKVQSRLSGNASLSTNASISASLSDMSAKLSDATSLSTAAQAEIVGLKPDNGDASVRASNTAALKDARAKIKSAHQDLVAARKDAGDIVRLVVGSGAGIRAAASTSAQ